MLECKGAIIDISCRHVSFECAHTRISLKVQSVDCNFSAKLDHVILLLHGWVATLV